MNPSQNAQTKQLACRTAELFFKNETTDRGGYWVDWVPGVDVLLYESRVAERLIDKWAGG